MRYPDFDAGRLVKTSAVLVQSGDGIWFTAVGAMASFGAIMATVGFSISASPWFLLLLLIPALVAGVFITYFLNTWDSGWYSEDDNIKKATRLYSKLNNDPILDSYARPLMENIYAHAKERDGHYSLGTCGTCKTRIDALKKLVPTTLTGKSDVQSALDFVEMRKSIDTV